MDQGMKQEPFPRLPRVTRRGVLGAAGALPVAAFTAGCGAEAPAPKQSGPVTITYMGNLPSTHPAGAARLELLREFNKTNTQQITVDLAEAEASTNEAKAKTLAAAGAPPNLFYAAYYFSAEFLSTGMTIDLETELKGDREWAKQKADIYPNMLETSMWAGKLAGMPGYTNNTALVYNPDLLQQSGVAAPKQGWTWDEFTTVAQRFVRRTTSSGDTLIPLSMGWNSWSTYLGTTGSRIISKDNKKITADTPEFLSVMELWLDYLRRGIILTRPDGQMGLNETYQLAKNDTVFEVQGPFRLPTFRERKAREPLTVHVPVHPTKKQIHAVNGGHSLIVFKDAPADKRSAAAQVAKWLNAPHAQAQMSIRNFIPVSKSVAADPALQAYVKTDPAFKGFLDLASAGWRWPSLPSYDKINKAVQDNVDAIMRQETGPKAGLEKMQREAQTLLDADVRLMG